jgi:hypothetical protein
MEKLKHKSFLYIVVVAIVSFFFFFLLTLPFRLNYNFWACFSKAGKCTLVEWIFYVSIHKNYYRFLMWFAYSNVLLSFVSDVYCSFIEPSPESWIHDLNSNYNSGSGISNSLYSILFIFRISSFSRKNFSQFQ